MRLNCNAAKLFFYGFSIIQLKKISAKLDYKKSATLRIH